MLSALPPSHSLFGNPFQAFDGAFMPSDCPDFLAFCLDPVTSPSSSDDPNRTHEEEKPASDQSNRDASVMEERKRKRMISNRESARRSRIRKQRHIENLRNQLSLFRVENRELNNRLQFILFHSNRVRTENDWLRSEQILLRQKLSNISRMLVFQESQPLSAWPCAHAVINMGHA